jgi:hypothetical protein
MIEMGKEEVAAGKYKEYDPERYDFFWNKDFTAVKIVPLTWWDDKSYLAYQTGE